MNYAITRTKGGRTLHAIHVDANTGHVKTWANHAIEASVPQAVADKVKAHYAKAQNTGQIRMFDELGREVWAVNHPPREDLPTGTTTAGDIEAALARANSDLVAARLRVADLEAKMAAEQSLVGENQALEARAKELGEEVEALVEEQHALRAKVKELEAIIASAE